MITKSILENKAFALFRAWTNNAKTYRSNINIAISDESMLVRDLLEAIHNSQIALIAESKHEKRQLIGFDKGFVEGFICSQLNATWNYQYIVKQTEEYKQFLAFKALKIYLEFDKLSEIHISSIYRNLIEENNNLLDWNQAIEHKNIENEKVNELVEIPQSEIIKAINNQINGFVNDYLTRTSPDYLECLSSHFSDEELISIINNLIEE